MRAFENAGIGTGTARELPRELGIVKAFNDDKQPSALFDRVTVQHQWRSDGHGVASATESPRELGEWSPGRTTGGKSVAKYRSNYSRFRVGPRCARMSYRCPFRLCLRCLVRGCARRPY